MKVIFDYDSISGSITGANGMFVVMPGMVPFEDAEKSSRDVNEIKELVAAGVSIDEILKLKREGAL